MAKPCRYQLPGQDTWMSEQELMQKLNDGLLDKFMSDNNIAVRNFKFTPNQDLASKFRTPVETAPKVEGEKITDSSKFNWGDARDFSDNVLNEKIEEAKIDLQRETNEIERARLEDRIGFAERILKERTTETKADETPQAEEGKYFIDGKEVSREEAIKEIQDESRRYDFNLSGKKIEYQGSNEQAAREIEKHNESISPLDKEGKLKSNYIDAAIKKAFNSVPFRKFGDAYRKHIDPYFKQTNNETRVGGMVKKGMSWSDLASYIIGDGQNLATEEQFRAFAKDLGLEVPTQETPQAEATPTTPKSETVAEVKEVKIPKNKKEREEAAVNDEMIYHSWFGSTIESTPQQYNDALKEIAETGAIEDVYKYGKNIPESQGPSRYLYSNSLLNTSQEDAQSLLGEKGKKSETKAQPTLSKKDQEEAKILENDLDYYTRQMEDAQDQIDIEKSNFKEEKERISQEKAKVRLSKMSKDKKADKLEELDAELSDIKDDHDDLIEQYKDDIQEAKSELKRINNRKAKLEQKAKALVAETKAEPTTKAEEKLSPRVEKLKNDFVESYNSIPAKNNRQRSRKYQYISSKQSSLDPEERQAAELATSEIYQQDKATQEAKAETKTEPIQISEPIISKSENFEWDGEWNVEYDGRVGSIYRDPSGGGWNAAGPEHFTRSHLGYTKKEAIQSIKNGSLAWIKNSKKVEPTTKVETKAQPVAPQETTVSKVTEKSGPKTTQEAKVKAISQRGGNLEYTVKSISEDGKTATVQAPDRLKNPSDATQGKIPGEVSTLTIKENINGERVVETDKRTTVYLDRVIAPAETTLFETKKKEEAVEKKDGRGTKKSVTFAIDTGRDVTRFTPKVTMEKNNRTNTWELIKPDGTKMEASVELQNQAQLEYNKQNGIEEQAKEVQQETIEANKDNPEAQEFAKSDIGMNAAEAFVEPTDTQPKQKRKRTKQQANRDYQATARRGASTNVTQAFIDKLKNAFPDVSVFNDQDSFDTIANRLGRPPGTAAILYNGAIYLNPSQANVNTALEEYAHVYLLVIKSINPSLYRMGIELVRKDGKQYLDEVKNDPGYDDISNDPEAQAFEALSKMIADRGETIEDARQKSKVKEFLKDLWRGIYQFISGKSKIKEGVDTLESYVDKVSRELLKNSPISNLSVSDLSKLQNKENVGNISVKSSIIERTTNRAIQFNRIFRPNRGVSQSIADRVNKAQNMVKIFENRSNAVLKEFNSGMKDYYKQKGINTDAEKLIVLRDVDRALKDSEFRNNWFSSDSEAETLIKPSVDKMRSLVDKLSTDLKNSGMLSDDLELTIDGNLDMYLNTSYMFYSPSYTGEWMDVFTPDEKDQILDYFRGQRVQPAKTIVYKVNNDGSVEATFENSFGDKIERRYDTMDSFKMALAETARYEPATGLPGNTKLDVVALNLSDSKGKEHKLNFNQGLDISSIDRFSSADSSIIGYINDQRKEIIEKKTSAESFIFGNQAVADNKTNKILERRKNMTEVQRLLLKEIQDPSTNFLNTIRKQSELLFKRGLEQEIVNSGYLARSTIQGNLTKKLNKPGSLLNGLYVTPEMHDLLTNKKILDLTGGGKMDIITIPSTIMKALVTIASPTSNAANFGSGFVQTLMTGNNPFSSDMATAMRALQEQAKVSRASKGGITTEDVYGIFFNQVPTVLRGIVNVANIKPKGFKEGISKLSDDQKQQYGVNSFDQLSDQDKARVILEELIENGAIAPGIDSGIVMDLLVNSLQNKEISQNQKSKITDSFKKKGAQVLDIAANVYQFSDSMFKAIVYMQEKARRYDTYGSVMKKKGMSDQEIEAEIRRMTAEVVKKQMPSYDRSPEVIKAISRIPFIGPFVQFDYQSKVNGFNILADATKLMADGRNMIKEGYVSEGTKLLFNGARKALASTSTWFMSYGITKFVSYLLGGFAGDDDETVRLLLPEYRRYNPIIHTDSEANGQHGYIDIGRIDPQSLYLKYYRAFSEEGFAAGIEEILRPYLAEDIFYGGLFDTLFNYNKYGEYDKRLERMTVTEKLSYLLNERLLPSTAFGAAERLTKAFEGIKQNDVSLSPAEEIINVLFGVKQRDINISKESGNMIHYKILKEIDDDRGRFNDKLKEFQKKEESGAKITETDRENLQEAYEELVTNSNQRVQDARDMVLRLKNLGTKEDVIKKSLEDANTPKYLINKVMADEFIPIKYDEEGDRIQYKTPKSTGRPSRPSRPKRPKRPSR